MFKRIFLFLAVNLLVVLSISLILALFGVQPYLTQHGIDYRALLIFCFIWGMGGAFISLALSRQMAKWMMRVKVIDPQRATAGERELLNTVYALCRSAGLTDMPQVGIYPSPEVNAFATGPTKKRSLIAVSSGLLQKMDQREIEGVIGHEISHIVNGDMVTMTLLQGIVNAFVMFLARILAYVIAIAGRSRNESSSPSYFTYVILVFLFEIVFMLLGSMIIAAFSRYREFRADKGGATLVGKEKMIEALQSLKTLESARAPQIAASNQFQAMKIAYGKKSGLIRLFATHPPMEERIERLQRL
jgi:heat shock protein HtpX